jgi:uncharacterized protein YifE (UPF0438 family)|tara:strand:+ start:722 stop:967 length:246 start_codon:yes stop_codon:yes gene_type:complete
MNKIKEEELKELKHLNEEFNKTKTQLGDLTLQKHGLCLKVESLKKDFQVLELKLMETYGKDSVINLETGEIKPKEKDGENK